MSEGTLWAGDCASPGDCGAVPDNGSRAAAAGAAAAGGGLAWRTHNKNRKMPPIQLQRGPQPPAGKIRPSLFKRVQPDGGMISVPGVGEWQGDPEAHPL